MNDRPSSTPHVRPLLLGYLRAAVLGSADAIHGAQAELEAFAQREDFSLGRVFVDIGPVSGAFAALVDELARNETARGIVIPDARHLTCDEQVVLSRHEHGSRIPVLMVNALPRAGGPGAPSPGAGSATPPRRSTERQAKDGRANRACGRAVCPG